MEIQWELPLRPDGLDLVLDNGMSVTVRPIRDDDAELLQATFQAMSPRSRYLRFFTMAQQLSEAMARSLAEIDHERHWAWVVFDPDAESGIDSDEGRAVAVARVVRLESQPEVAEAAVAVIDDYHGRGVGQLLLRLLTATAVRSDVAYLRFEVLSENQPMRSLLTRLEARLNRELSDYSTLVWDVPVTGSDEDETMGAVYEILRWIAASEPEDVAPASGESTG